MTKSRIFALAAVVAAAAGSIAAPGARAAEGCGAVYSAGQTNVGRCTYTATAPGAIVASSVNWKVTVKRGASTLVFGANAPAYHPSSGAPIKAGDVVTAEVFGPGAVIVGTATEGDGVVLPQP
jgi:hypothetical protein